MHLYFRSAKIKWEEFRVRLAVNAGVSASVLVVVGSKAPIRIMLQVCQAAQAPVIEVFERWTLIDLDLLQREIPNAALPVFFAGKEDRGSCAAAFFLRAH
jgi:hypothetical protein